MTKKQKPEGARGRWKVRTRNAAILMTLVLVIAGWLISDHLRTLLSLERVEGTNIYVMDYFAEYDMDEIRRQGVDLENVEGSFIDALFPQGIAWIARNLKATFVPDKVEVVEVSSGHHCSTIARRTQDGHTLFGRNFDSPNDALLILRIHEAGEVQSVAVIDLQYLNMNRDDLTEVSLIGRIPLLFAPYYVMDGVNKHGLAVSGMSVPEAKAPQRTGAPDIIQSSLMRLVLDYCDSVEEALELMEEYNISFAQNSSHLMLADASGAMVVVEFIDGQIRKVEPSDDWLASTNHTLWSRSKDENCTLCVRYRTGSDAMSTASHGDESLEFERAIQAMSVENWTMWTSVYDLNDLSAKVMYKSHGEQSFVDTSMSNAPGTP